LSARFGRPPVILDGALGTELERRGIPTPAPLWSSSALLDAREAVYTVHREYAEAGAEILTANTFRTNPRALAAAGRAADGPALCAIAVDLARRAAAGRDIIVAASVAPVEDCYSPQRTPGLAELEVEHDLFAAWLARAAPDLLLIETIGTLREALAAARAAAERELPFIVSFATREDGRLLGGDSLREALLAIAPLAPLAVGLNCIPPRGITQQLPALRKLTRLPLIAYGHIGNARPTPGWSFSEALSPDDYALAAAAWVAAGAAIIGGCCGTTPAHVGRRK
jgi:S-methylmethionine-dependent homocysteine/selenocysteine methylase